MKDKIIGNVNIVHVNLQIRKPIASMAEVMWNITNLGVCLLKIDKYYTIW